MSFQPPQFKNFGKSLKDLFKDGYDFKKQLKLKSANGPLSLESSVEAKGADFAGGVKFTQKNSDLGTFESELQTSGSVKYSWKNDKLSQGLVVKVSGDEAPVGKVEVDYGRDMFAGNLTAEASSKATLLSAATAVGTDGVSVGTEVSYNLKDQKVADYNAGAEYSEKDLAVTVKTSSRAEQIETGYFHKINGDLTVGASFSYNLGNGNRGLVLGGAFKIDGNNLVRTKFNESGVLSANFEHKLPAQSLKAGFAAEYQVQTGSVPQKFGIVLTYGDN